MCEGLASNPAGAGGIYYGRATCLYRQGCWDIAGSIQEGEERMEWFDDSANALNTIILEKLNMKTVMKYGYEVCY